MAETVRAASESERFSMLLDAFEAALHRVAEIDGLDRAIIQEAVNATRAEGLFGELWGPSAENGRHAARMMFRLDPNAVDACFWLEMTNKRTQQRRTIDLGSEKSLVVALPLREGQPDEGHGSDRCR